MGRTALVSRALHESSATNQTILRLTPSGRAPLATLGAFVPSYPDTSLDTRVIAATGKLGRIADRTRLVAVVDDAHLADHASLLALRELTRQGRVRLIITQPAGRGRTPDPVDCLRYERDATMLHIGPLGLGDVATLLDEVIGDHVHPATVAALHAASGGRPRVLRNLVVAGNLLDCLAARTDGWRLRTPAGHLPEPLTGPDADQLVTATERAWRSLDLDQTEELCRLAAWRGIDHRVRSIWAGALMLRGQPERSLRLLDMISDVDPHLALVRAAALALGLHRPEAAAAYLTGIGDRTPSLRARVDAYRSWLLAVAGHRDLVPAVVGDRETHVFRDAARATLALTEGRPTAAVGQLRRALAAADCCRDELPWLAPFLTASLIDALLLAGRIREATATATEFHAGRAGYGWDIAVVIAALASQTTAAPSVRETNEGMRTA